MKCVSASKGVDAFFFCLPADHIDQNQKSGRKLIVTKVAVLISICLSQTEDHRSRMHFTCLIKILHVEI